MARNRKTPKEHFNTPLAQCAGIESYLNKHDAFLVSMRRAAVFDEYQGYTHIVGTIEFADDGGVTCSDPEFAPNDSEQKNIRADLASLDMPKPFAACSGLAWPDNLEQEQRDGKVNLHFVRDHKGDNLMIVARYEKDGQKWFIPYSFWSDMEWRKCEPDGFLPLWGVEHIWSGCTVFIHEGFKAAEACHAIANPQGFPAEKAAKAHPFYQYLRSGVHVGWHGGATNPGRSDWGALRKYGVSNVVIVTDNDDAGRSAAAVISKNVGLPAKLMQFSEDFPSGFDLGDEFPSSMFKEINGVKRYTGPSPESLLYPATWATRTAKAGQGNKVNFVPTQHFLREWIFVSNVGLFVHKDFPSTRLTEHMFNGLLGRFSDLKRVSDLLIKNRVQEVPNLCYRPESPPGLVTAGDGQAFNVFSPSRIMPEEGDVTPFLDFIAYLVPDPSEAHEVLRWCATLVARPEMRMEYALLLVSEAQGTGKTTLAERILKPLVGPHNTCIPGETMIVSDFNDWASCKRLVVVSEIYQGHSWKPYNRLKALITDPIIRVNEKHKSPYDIENRLHIVACSNSRKALRMDTHDRRWFVPTLTEEPWTRAQFEGLNSWLELGGLEIIAHWASEWGDYVKIGEAAPKSIAKARMAAESHSEHVKEAVRLVEGFLEDDALRAIRLSRVIAKAKEARKERCYDEPRDFRKALSEAGWQQYPDRLTFDGQKDYVLMNPAASLEISKTPKDKPKKLRGLVETTLANLGSM